MTEKTRIPLAAKIAIFAGLVVVILIVVAGIKLDRAFSEPVATGPLNSDRVVIANRMRAECRKKQRDNPICKCSANATARYLSDREARALAATLRQNTEPTKSLGRTLVKAALRAGFKCGLEQSVRGRQDKTAALPRQR